MTKQFELSEFESISIDKNYLNSVIDLMSKDEVFKQRVINSICDNMFIMYRVENKKVVEEIRCLNTRKVMSYINDYNDKNSNNK